MTKDPTPKALKAAIAEFRAAHYVEEMEANLRVWQEIRDNTGSADKDRADAAKKIAQAVGGLAPERASTTAPGPQAPGSSRTYSISDKEKERIDALLRAHVPTHGKPN